MTLQLKLSKQQKKLKKKQLSEVANQTSSPEGIQEPVPFLNRPNSYLIDIQESRKHIMTELNGDSNVPPFTITTPNVEERLVREEESNQL